MNANLLPYIDAWQSLTVLIIGDAILDGYLIGHSERLCREAPAPVVAITQQQNVPGGAANTAANVANLGGQAILLSVIGADREGEQLRQALEQQGVSTASLISSAQRQTLAKQRVISKSQILVRLDQGSSGAISSDLEQIVIARLREQFCRCDAVIVSDYSYGILTPAVIQALAELQAQYPRTLVIDSKRLTAYRDVRATAVKPNYDETLQILELPRQAAKRSAQIAAHADTLLDLTGAAIVAVTLDSEGAVVFERHQPAIYTDAQPVPPNQTSGAGDTFTSALTLTLAAGASTTAAATLAAAATAVAVQQSGTTTCSVTALRHSFAADGYISKMILDRSELTALVRQYRASAQQIIFTNGCFDILHPGHVAYLMQAKALGDVLIVGVNSDDSVRRLKGQDRPVNRLEDRMTILSALSCIDYVVPFTELNPNNLIRIICPDIYVKGGDYTREALPEVDLVEELGGIVRILPYVDNRSTTQLIAHIRAHL